MNEPRLCQYEVNGIRCRTPENDAQHDTYVRQIVGLKLPVHAFVSPEPEGGPGKYPIDRPCSACSAGDTEMEYHDHQPPFRVGYGPEPVAPEPPSQFNSGMSGYVRAKAPETIAPERYPMPDKTRLDQEAFRAQDRHFRAAPELGPPNEVAHGEYAMTSPGKPMMKAGAEPSQPPRAFMSALEFYGSCDQTFASWFAFAEAYKEAALDHETKKGGAN